VAKASSAARVVKLHSKVAGFQGRAWGNLTLMTESELVHLLFPALVAAVAAGDERMSNHAPALFKCFRCCAVAHTVALQTRTTRGSTVALQTKTTSPSKKREDGELFSSI
jgi:hypothetical protein